MTGYNIVNEGIVQHLEEWAGDGTVTICDKPIPPGTTRYSRGTSEFEVCPKCTDRASFNRRS